MKHPALLGAFLDPLAFDLLGHHPAQLLALRATHGTLHAWRDILFCLLQGIFRLGQLVRLGLSSGRSLRLLKLQAEGSGVVVNIVKFSQNLS